MNCINFFFRCVDHHCVRARWHSGLVWIIFDYGTTSQYITAMHAGQKLIRRFSLIITIHEAKYAYSYIGQGLMIWMMPGLGTHYYLTLSTGYTHLILESDCTPKKKCVSVQIIFYYFTFYFTTQLVFNQVFHMVSYCLKTFLSPLYVF